MCYKCEDCGYKFEGSRETTRVYLNGESLNKLVSPAMVVPSCPQCGSDKIFLQVRSVGRKNYVDPRHISPKEMIASWGV